MTPPFVARRGALAVALGILGLAAGWATADFFCLSSRSGELVLRWALLSVTPLAAAAIGGLAARALDAAWWKASALVALVSLAVGAVTGVLLGAVTEASTHVQVHGAISGLGAAAAMLPAVFLIFFAERNVGRARAGSLIGGLDRRAVAAAVAFAVAFGVVVAVPRWFTSVHRPDRPSPDGPVTFAILAIAALVVVLVADIRALLVAQRCAVEVGAMAPRDAESSEAPRRFVDLGVGEAWVEHVVRPVTAYRGAAEVLSSIRGDAIAARRIASRAVIRGVLAVALAVHAMSVAFTPALAERVRSAIAPAEMVDPNVAQPRDTADAVGVAACDQYFDDVERCFAKDAAVRDALKDSIAQNRAAWKVAAETPAGRDALVQSCTMAREALNNACK
jgi:hypothetical protein